MSLEPELDRDGYTVLRRVYSSDEMTAITAELTAALATAADDRGSIRASSGAVYAARNLLAVFPAARTLWRTPMLTQFLSDTLGNEFGLVRGLFFDKPPEQSWSLAWHKDLTIAVERNDLPTTAFRHPTHKAGVPHVEAPTSLLESMLTLRIHLDRVTDKNGPLKVIAGSHRTKACDEVAGESFDTILADAGDVLAMRPLLSHSSGNSQCGTKLHRRVIHLEFAARRELPDGYAWHDFQPATGAP